MARRPPQLDDAAWLRQRLTRYGTPAIAKELGCSAATVRAARRRHGIPPAGAGRRRGVPVKTSTVNATPVITSSSLELIGRRLAFEAAHGSPAAGPSVVATRIHTVHQACAQGDALALEDAVTTAAAGLAAWLDQLRQTRLTTMVDAG